MAEKDAGQKVWHLKKKQKQTFCHKKFISEVLPLKICNFVQKTDVSEYFHKLRYFVWT